MNRLTLVLGLLLIALGWALKHQTEAIGELRTQLQFQSARAEALTESIANQRQLLSDAAAIDRKRTEALTDAQAENDRLAARVDAGDQRLLIRAECPARAPATAATPGVDDAATAELNPAARSDYHALRRQITQTEAALAGLQEWVARVCL